MSDAHYLLPLVATLWERLASPDPAAPGDHGNAVLWLQELGEERERRPLMRYESRDSAPFKNDRPTQLIGLRVL